MHTANLLDRLAPELIPFILENLSLQDLKKCCSINDIWKDEVFREIHRRLIVDCTFIDDRVTFKMYGSKYPAVKELGIGATNADRRRFIARTDGWFIAVKIVSSDESIS
ncbi:hypothetical protein RhiirC2_793487 [Rhizophagus irregularis]|uniref:F-box domain-containing protein n=1 Tax=Rhizophagus irregularis TaxID=588596 RepID=A0A2N1MFA1_9GLOM|nr:hypothetical protein RhiirC2_793487 [Rhizophagus irregularis]